MWTYNVKQQPIHGRRGCRRRERDLLLAGAASLPLSALGARAGPCRVLRRRWRPLADGGGRPRAARLRFPLFFAVGEDRALVRGSPGAREWAAALCRRLQPVCPYPLPRFFRRWSHRPSSLVRGLSPRTRGCGSTTAFRPAAALAQVPSQVTLQGAAVLPASCLCGRLGPTVHSLPSPARRCGKGRLLRIVLSLSLSLFVGNPGAGCIAH